MSLKVPFFSLARQYTHNESLFQSAINSVLESQQFIGGKIVENFEKQLATYAGTQYAVACNSGTDALWMALKALNITPNTIVLTTPFSFIASSSEAVDLGGHPVFIDIETDSYNIDPVLLEAWLNTNAFMRKGQAIEKRTGFAIGGLIVVNIFGQCANYPAIRAIADAWNLWIIEDAAQSLGASIGQTKTFGDVTTYSFYPTKNLGAFGDGGAVATDNEYLAQRILQLRNHGRRAHYEYLHQGINSRLDGIQASLLSAKLPLLDQWNARRKQIADRYHKQLSHCTSLMLPAEKIGNHVFHQYSVIINDPLLSRDQFAQALATKDIETRVFYPQPLHQIDFLITHPHLVQACPIAEQTSRTIMALPMWPELTDAEVDQVCSIILEVATPVHAAMHTQPTINF